MQVINICVCVCSNIFTIVENNIFSLYIKKTQKCTAVSVYYVYIEIILYKIIKINYIVQLRRQEILAIVKKT